MIWLWNKKLLSAIMYIIELFCLWDIKLSLNYSVLGSKNTIELFCLWNPKLSSKSLRDIIWLWNPNYHWITRCCNLSLKPKIMIELLGVIIVVVICLWVTNFNVGIFWYKIIIGSTAGVKSFFEVVNHFISLKIYFLGIRLYLRNKK